jgi:hypothetical protein
MTKRRRPVSSAEPGTTLTLDRDVLLYSHELHTRVKRRLPPSMWPLVVDVLRALADAARHPFDKPDPLERTK